MKACHSLRKAIIGGMKRKKTREQGGEIQRTEERTEQKIQGEEHKRKATR
jgi:hypothetical protein